MAQNGKAGPIILGGQQPVAASRSFGGGAVRARVRYPVTDAPHIKGKTGCAWEADLNAIRKRHSPGARKDAVLCHWIMEVPWAHPLWHSYSLILIHLRPMDDERPTIEYISGATHEVHLYALNPDTDRQKMLSDVVPGAWLSPVNFAAQFVESSDERAEARIAETVVKVCSGRLNPDTEFQRDWSQLFGDNMLKSFNKEDAEEVVKNIRDKE